MTPQDFASVFQEIEQNVVDLIKDVVPPETKVIGRSTFSDAENVWLGRIKDSNGQIHCYSVQYVGTDESDDSVAVATAVFTAKFQIIAFMEYSFGTDADNSSRRFADELHALRFVFLNNQRLNSDWVCSHSGFSERLYLTKLDGRDVHLAKIDLKVQLEPLSYEYN